MERLIRFRRIKQGLHTCHTNPHIKVPEFLYPNIHPRAVGEDRTVYAAVQKKLSEKEVFVIVIPDQFTGHLTCPGLWDAVLQAICKCLPCARSNRYLSKSGSPPGI